ncbi:hypothetical protein DFJ77DRAFT_259197 [Powellomyces hirtus]|nr:hypothetical protein DFJ77DRAFT_259197 [Powellomyces hirtus]
MLKKETHHPPPSSPIRPHAHPQSPAAFSPAWALYDYTGAGPEELSFRSGAVFDVVQRENRDWWYVRCRDGTRGEGFVPTTYVTDDAARAAVLAPLPLEPRIRERDESDDDDHGDDDTTLPVSHPAHRRSSITSSSAPSRPRERGRERDRHPHRHHHHHHSTPNRQPSKTESDFSLPRRRSSRKPLTTPDAALALDGFAGGPLPAGFRVSTLATTQAAGTGTLADSIAPKLSHDALEFRDLTWDAKKNMIRERPTALTIGLTLLSARRIPLPGDHIHILGRVVRMALFDGTAIMGNLHAVPATWNPDVASEWRFCVKASILFPKDDPQPCFLRAGDIDSNLSLLFELCLVVRDPRGKSDTRAELSCGWGCLPLMTAQGAPLDNRAYEIALSGGTPFERNVPLQTDMSKQGFIEGIVHPNRHPRLNVKVWRLSRSQTRRTNQLPTPLLCSLLALPLLTQHRHLLAHTLHSHRASSRLPGTASPALTTFPILVSDADLLRILRTAWDRARQTMTRAERRDPTRVRHLWIACVADVAPIAAVKEVGPCALGCEVLEQVRHHHLLRIRQAGALESFAGSVPTTPTTTTHYPFSMRPFSVQDEVRFSFLAAAGQAESCEKEG